MDAASQKFFDRLRAKHFPVERNFLHAHCTLFHALPGSRRAAIEDDLAQLASTNTPLLFRVSEVKIIGQGVAYALDCPQLIALHAALQKAWDAWLTPQDKRRLWPHITVQNKVPPALARETAIGLTADFQPFDGAGTGLALWAFLGGPWQLLCELRFGKAAL